MRIWICVLLLLIPQFSMGQSANFPVNSLTAGSINGAFYPARCGDSTKPSWCSGTNAGQWILAACAAAPSVGAFVDLLGLSGTISATTRGCSTPGKQVTLIQDPTQTLTITETDGDITFPLDTYSSFIGPGAGQCVYGRGLVLGASANVTAIVGPAHVDATEEAFTASGLCLKGNDTATVSTGLLYAKYNYTNTTIWNNNAVLCNNACLWLENLGGSISIMNNEFNPSGGSAAPAGSAIVIVGSGSATGCLTGNISIWQGNSEHAEGGASYPEINIYGNGIGGLVCDVHLHDIYVERDSAGTPSVTAIRIQDCWNCSLEGFQGSGSTGGTDFINISETAAGRTKNVLLYGIHDDGSWTNVINDTLPNGSVITAAAYPLVAYYSAGVGLFQPASVTSKNINGRLVADVYPGADCGAKVNAAITDLASSPGYIEMTPACGTITTAITLAANQHLFARPGIYNVGAVISAAGANSTVECDPVSDDDAGTGSCIFHENNSVNLSEVFLLSGNYSGLSNVTVDGNYTNNSTAGPDVMITGLRARVDHANVINAETSGFYVGAVSQASNVAAATKLDHVFAVSNHGNGITCSSSSDLFVGDQSEIENNTGNGISLYNCGGSRVDGNTDVSGNHLNGISISGTTTGAQGAFATNIVGNTFSNQYENDIYVQGWDASSSYYASEMNQIVGNIFQGSSNHGNAVYDAIKIQDSGLNTIVGNTVQDIDGSSLNYRAGVELITSASPAELSDTFSGNTLYTPTPIIPPTVDKTVYGPNTYQTTNNTYSSGVPGPVSAIPLILGGVPVAQAATQPTGSCSAIAWVLSNDGHMTFCNGSTYVSKF